MTGFIANFASAPPVNGSPPRPSASTAAGTRTNQTLRLVEATAPIARNRPPLTKT
jgi:hypothetical protein